MPDPSSTPALPGTEPPAQATGHEGPVRVGDLVISWYDDKPVAYGGDTGDSRFTELSFGLLQGGPPVLKCPPDRVAPACVPIPERDDRVSVARRARTEMPYGEPGIWYLTLPGVEHGSWHRTKRDATATGLRRLAILDWHAARAAQPGRSGDRALPPGIPVPALQVEDDEGQWWWLRTADREWGPFSSSDDAVDSLALPLCDEDWASVTGLLAECQDGCNLPLDHDGVCGVVRENTGPELACVLCASKAGRLTMTPLSDILAWGEAR